MKIENLFNKKKRATAPTSSVLQTARDANHPFGAISRYTPLSQPEFKLYDAMREAIPIIDAAVTKIIGLVGGFEVKCKSKYAEEQLREFLETVPVGNSMLGIDTFVAQHLESLIMYGTAVGEILPSVSGKTVAALYNAPLDILEIERDPDRHSPRVCVRNGAEVAPVKHPEFIVVSALNPRPGEIRGRSLFSSLPFVSGILLKIFNTVGINFERIGNMRFAVTYKPSGDAGEKAYAKERALAIANEWSRAMRDSQNGKVSDFVAVGDISIKTIGADNQTLDTEVPVRHLLEQIVARTGLPPFMLGLSWSATERMSSQQADMLTTELWNYRRILTPLIKRVCDLFLAYKGIESDYTIEWNEITLQDEVETARARLLRFQAEKIEENINKPSDDDGKKEEEI